MKQKIRQAVVGLGGDSLVSAYQHWHLPYMQRRDQDDMRNLGLLLRFCLSEMSNCVDVGANEGLVLRRMVSAAPGGRHFAFEPLPYLARRLADEFPGVDVRQVALSDQGGTSSDFTHVVDAPGYSGFREQSYPQPMRTETIPVRVETLDDALPPGYRPDLIKIDVEGAESMVIAGGLETIRTCRPLVVFEHFEGGASHYGSGPGEIYDLLVTEAGLRIWDIDGDGPYTRDRMQEVYESRRLWTFVAKPR